MLIRSLRILRFRFCNVHQQMKQAKLQEVIQLMMRPTQSLELISLPITNMVPGFFSKQLNCKMTPKLEVKAPRTNIPSNSFVQVTLGLSNDSYFNMIFQRLDTKHLRIGRMLEVMDSAAGITAYRYGHGSIDLNVDFIMATACVDSFTMFDEMVLGEDLVFATYVNYVGRTSMEVEVDVLQGDKIKAFALFTMVARHKSDHNKAYELPFLNLSEEPDLPKAKLRYERGVTNRSKSQEQAKKAFDKSIPEKEEIKLLMSVLGKKKSAQSNDNSIKMRSTVSSKSLLMHSQDRNVQGKIFGGFLMREMIELAWFSCMKASKGKQARFKDIQDVFFHQPVDVGNGLVIQSIVSYVEDSHMVVKVSASKIIFDTQQQIKTCEVHIIFQTMDESLLQQVIPETFQEGLNFLQGKRKLNNMYV